jgi:hypothetical protein
MLNKLQERDWFTLISKVLTLSAAIIIAPFALVACVPLVCVMAPVAVIALPFMLGAFFGETKAMRPVQQPQHQLQPHLAH